MKDPCIVEAKPVSKQKIFYFIIDFAKSRLLGINKQIKNTENSKSNNIQLQDF